MRNSSPTNQENDSSGIILIALLVVICLVIWHQTHADIAYYMLKLNYKLLSLLDSDHSPDFIRNHRQYTVYAAQNAEKLTFSQLLQVLNKVSYIFVSIPVALTGWMLYQVRKHPSNTTKRKITAPALRKIMAEHAYATIPVLYYGDLLSSDNPRHSPALSPDEWASKNQVILNGRLNEAKTQILLSADLGERLATLEDLAIYEKLLFLVFASKIFGGAEAQILSQDILDDLNYSCHSGEWENEPGYPDFELDEALFTRFSTMPEIQQLFQVHRYSKTFLFRLHLEAMKRGKVPTTYFRWLKGIDRSLWYALNTTGRKTAFIESAAVFTQVQWEMFAEQQGYLLIQPNVGNAVKALKEYLEERKITVKDDNHGKK